jgi:hypothetical protein
MATVITCDKCNKQITTPIRVEFNDGEHPHNGSLMTIIKDLCRVCAQNSELELRVDKEWDVFEKAPS